MNQLSTDLKDLYGHGFKQSYLWNSLHGTEFGVGYYLNFQVVSMVAHMFGADQSKVPSCPLSPSLVALSYRLLLLPSLACCAIALVALVDV